ncbi:MAG: glycosyltransferase family 2 protein [Pseudomonadota bacterium]
MRAGERIGAVIPALNEARAISLVIGDIPTWVDQIVVGDNGSTDGTGEIARRAGAVVVREEERGYGAACLAALRQLEDIDVVVFLDGDRSDYPEDMHLLVEPILTGTADMVIGSRAMGTREPGALTPQQRFGNWLATFLIHVFWGTRYTDLGPFRAIRWASLEALSMADRNYGWTVEMQIKAIEQGLRVHEVPARYRRGIGQSKVSGTVKGSLMAGYKILYIIARHALRRLRTCCKLPARN